MINFCAKEFLAFSLATRALVKLFFCLFFYLCLSHQSVFAQSVIPKQLAFSDFDQGDNPSIIRALIVIEPGYYFIDQGKQSGISYDLLKAFENYINKKYRRYLPQKFNIIYIPVDRSQLIPYLQQGLGDIIVAHMTQTELKDKLVQFTQPINSKVNEILITQAGSKSYQSPFELSGKTLWLRKSSSYYESVQVINQSLTQIGLAPIYVNFLDEQLEDADVLEMVNAGLIDKTIVDSHKATFWLSIFDKIQLHSEAVFRFNSQISWAVRKENPILLKEVNSFIKQHKKGTLFGNLLFWRYLKRNDWAKKTLKPIEQIQSNKFIEILNLIKRYSQQYDFDWIMIAAQGFQESSFNQKAISHKGAVGVMQLLPSTAKEPYINLPNIHKLEDNIHAGVKYMHFIRKRYFSNDSIDPVNSVLLSFAAYNAGPNRIQKLQTEAENRGLESDVWFNNMEVIVAENIGWETVQYVNNIYKYYLAFRDIRLKIKEKKEIKLRWQSKKPTEQQVSMLD